MSSIKGGAPVITRHLPKIEENDYAAFRKLLGLQLPETYNQWFLLRENDKRDAARYGHEALEVRVSPDELRAYCATSGATCNLSTLELMATYKGAGQVRDRDRHP
jgi:hypothetical protein